jgi:hypothetical protein
LIELNPDYAALAQKRLEEAFMGPDERMRNGVTPEPAGPLFSSLTGQGDLAC